MNIRPVERARSSTGAVRGFLITLEGIEGSGKSTHAERLAKAVSEAGYRVFSTREPGGTRLGEALRGRLLSGDPPVPEAELFLMLAARAQHVQEVLIPHLDRGEAVISDRYADASLAYQGGGRGLGLETVAAANALATSGLVPDLTILCDLPVEDALARVRRRRDGGGDYNRFDRERQEFYASVRAAYLEIAGREPARFEVVQTTASREEVAARLWELVRPRLALREEDGGLIRDR